MNDTFLPGNGFDTYESQDKVLVGMSGGVDSSVTVRILQQQGFGVMGAVIRFSPAHEEAVAAAHKAAQQLGVECITLDAQELFDQQVVQPFCQQYCAGRTPNPCVMCNPAVKFQALLTAADRLGIQYIATGHYARVELGEDGVSRICQPESAARDQSYMLGRLDQQVLSRLLLPLGEFEKEDIREMAGTLDWTAPMRRTAWRSALCRTGIMLPTSPSGATPPKQGTFSPRTGQILGRTRGCCTTP